MRESEVEGYLIERVEATGGLIRKIAYVGRRSCPDRLVGWGNARHALIETKRPLGRARADQEREHDRLRRVGFDVRVIDTKELVDKFVEEFTR